MSDSHDGWRPAPDGPVADPQVATVEDLTEDDVDDLKMGRAPGGGHDLASCQDRSDVVDEPAGWGDEEGQT